jgi:hypothetical protein
MDRRHQQWHRSKRSVRWSKRTHGQKERNAISYMNNNEESNKSLRGYETFKTENQEKLYKDATKKYIY